MGYKGGRDSLLIWANFKLCKARGQTSSSRLHVGGRPGKQSSLNCYVDKALDLPLGPLSSYGTVQLILPNLPSMGPFSDMF